MSEHDQSRIVSSGVDALIGRLKDEGVEEGRTQAGRLVSEAEARAKALVEQARAEAERIRAEARSEAEQLRRSGEEALNIAARDAQLALKRTLGQRFAGEVRRLVAHEMKKEELLRELIREVGGRVREEARADHVEILLPREVLGLEELRKNPKELEEGALTRFVRDLARDMLRDGVTFGVADDEAGGLRVHLVDDEITLDLSDEAVAQVLLQHLQPRFRALLEGIVK